MPAIENHTLKAGDDKIFTFKIDPTDVDTIEGCTVRWWMARSQYSKPDKAQIKKDNISGGEGGLEITDAAAQLFTVTLNRAETLGLIGNFYHEAEVTDPYGNWATVTTGTLTFERTLVRTEEGT